MKVMPAKEAESHDRKIVRLLEERRAYLSELGAMGFNGPALAQAIERTRRMIKILEFQISADWLKGEGGDTE